MEPITYIDRKTGCREIEQVFGSVFLNFLYGKAFFSRFFGTPFLHLLSQFPFFSWLYGISQTRSFTKRKISPFIKKFKIDPSEFLESIPSFSSFNDFFIRKLNPQVRPIDSRTDVAIAPADGRYLAFQDISKVDGFLVKGQKFSLRTFLDSEKLASEYSSGAMVIARLCPTDYHRFHFPCNCIPSKTCYINGWLYSVNPIALKKNIHIFSQNKRTRCELQTHHFGKVQFIEIGATFVGSIHQTYLPLVSHAKGTEKGYFSFGGSSLVLLFPPGSIVLDRDLIENTALGIETRCLMGQRIGISTSSENLSNLDMPENFVKSS